MTAPLCNLPAVPSSPLCSVNRMILIQNVPLSGNNVSSVVITFFFLIPGYHFNILMMAVIAQNQTAAVKRAHTDIRSSIKQMISNLHLL